jgi:hypothetical protein
MQTAHDARRAADLDEVATRFAAAADAATRASRRLAHDDPLAEQLDGMAHILWRFRDLLPASREPQARPPD